MQLQVFESREALMLAAADKLEDTLRAGLTARGAACAALSGGTTPEPAYRLLAARALDWPKVTFALVDERFVPPEHEASNEGLIRRALAPALAKGAQLLGLYQDNRPADAADAANAVYAPLDFDIALMGMGTDGHTASWFPGAEGLAEALDPAGQRAVTAIAAPDAAGAAQRLTLTLPAIARAEHVLLLITGADKRAVLGSAGPEAPVSVLLKAAGSKAQVYWAA